MSDRLTPEEWELAKLICTPKQLQALDYWRHDYGYKRIAIVLGVSRDIVRGRIDRALERISTPRKLSDHDQLLRQQQDILLRELERARSGGIVRGVVCYLCGHETNPENIHVDHMIPRAAGGPDEDWNKASACSDCNTRKSDRIVSFDIATRTPMFTYRPRA